MQSFTIRGRIVENIARNRNRIPNQERVIQRNDEQHDWRPFANIEFEYYDNLNREYQIIANGVPTEKMFLEKIPYMEYENIFLARALIIREQEAEMKKQTENPK